MDFTIIDVDYKINLSSDLVMAEIVPVVRFNSDRAMTFSAQVNIDGLEMISSFRVTALAGENCCRIKSFKIFNPRVRYPEDPDGIKIYKMNLCLFASENCFCVHDRELIISPEDAALDG